MPSWDALHISVDADPIAFDWNRVAQWLSPPALPSSSSASASAPKAAATTTPAPGAFDWTPVASLLVPSLLAFITCVAETKGSEAAFGAVQSLVDGMAVPWAVYLEQSTSGSAAKPATTAPAASNHNNTDADAWSNFSVKQLDTLGKLKFKTTVQWHALTAATASAASVTVVQLQQRMRLARRRFDAITLVLCASVTAPDLAFVLPQLYASLAYANKATAELCAVSSASAVTVQADTDANANANTDAVSDWLLAALRLAKIWRARLAVSPSSSASPVSASLSASAECAMFLLQVGAAARQHLPPRHSTVECITMSLTDLCQTMGDSGTAISALHECVTLLATSCASSSAINIAPPSTAVGQKTASAAARRVAVALPSDTNTSPSIISVETVVDSVRTVGARVRAMVSAASAASPEARGQCASTVQLVVPLLQETVALLNKRLKLPDMCVCDCIHVDSCVWLQF